MSDKETIIAYLDDNFIYIQMTHSKLIYQNNIIVRGKQTVTNINSINKSIIVTLLLRLHLRTTYCRFCLGPTGNRTNFRYCLTNPTATTAFYSLIARLRVSYNTTPLSQSLTIELLYTFLYQKKNNEHHDISIRFPHRDYK